MDCYLLGVAKVLGAVVDSQPAAINLELIGYGEQVLKAQILGIAAFPSRHRALGDASCVADFGLRQAKRLAFFPDTVANT